MASLQKNVASQNMTFVLVNATTGAGLTGATVACQVTKDGTAAASAGTLTELKVSGVGVGGYNYAPTQGETNAVDCGFLFTATNAVPVSLDFHTDVVDANGLPSVNAADILGAAISTPATAGILDVNVKNMNNVAATSITAVNANQGTTQPINFSGTGASAFVKSDTEQLNAQTVTAAAGVTFPASVASPTNLTAGTITTVTNLTNAPTAGDFTATMKTSITTAATAATPTAAAVTGAVGSVTGNVGGNVNGNVVGSVASVTAGVTVTTNNDKTGYALSTAGAGSIWDVVLSGHVTAGSTGAALNAAGGAGDPWQTTLPGAYVAGQAGYIVGNNLNASISGIPSSLFGTAVDGAFTFSQSIRLQNSALWGPISGCVASASGTATLQNVTGGTNRMTISYDSNGNRTAAATILNDAL